MKPISEPFEEWAARYRSRALNPQPERAYHCVPCRDTGFEVKIKQGPYGRFVNVAVVCSCTEGQARQGAQRARELEAAAGPRRKPRRQAVDPDAERGRYGD